MATTEPIEVELKGIGPIKNFSFTIDGPGVYVGRGANGTGKSTLLRAVSKRLGGDVSDLSVYDGAARGTLQLGDARLTVTQSRTSTGGELEILSIEGSLDIGSLVDPGLKNDAKNDDRRIKTLIALSGIEADPKMFHEVAGGEAAYLALGVDDKGADVLTLAARVKRAIEAQARTREETAESYLEKYRASKAAADGAPTGEADESKLAEALAAAQSKLDAMNAENKRRDDGHAERVKAHAALEALGELTDDPATLRKMGKEKEAIGLAKSAEAAKLRAQADALDLECESIDNEIGVLAGRELQAIAAAKKRAELSAAVTAGYPQGYTAEQIDLAAQAVDNARKAVEAGAIIRNARAKAAEAASHAAAAKVASKLARKLRDAAGEVDGALSKLLPKQCPLRVEAGRLVCETDRGKSELYSDLSDGEKWAMALKFAAQQLPPGGMLTLAQVAWESFAPALQAEIAGYVQSFGIVLVTAAVADGPLRVEKMKATSAGA